MMAHPTRPGFTRWLRKLNRVNKMALRLNMGIKGLIELYQAVLRWLKTKPGTKPN
jgi:hypothetical protein